MPHLRSKALTLFAVLSLTSLQADQLDDLNNAAHFLAGKPLPKPDKTLTATDFWAYHQDQMSKEWTRYDESTLAPMRKFAASEITPNQAKSKLVRYMFSGPDILHVLQMFPKANTFVLCGLEPVGEVPSLRGLSKAQANQALGEVRKALEESIQFSFFKTIDMKTDLQSAVFPGTLPIMCVFLAQNGAVITELDFLELLPDGRIQSLGPKAQGAKAVRVKFLTSSKHPQEFYYFTTNIADGEITKSGFMAFLESLPVGDSYVKAASYLMHNSYFSSVRNHLLFFSNVILQDDSGIPLQHFNEERWNLKFYGVYTSPIDLFAERYQPDLRSVYRSGAAEPLEFGTGYRWRKNESNLMRALLR